MLTTFLVGWVATSIVSYKVFFYEPGKEAIKILQDNPNKTFLEKEKLLSLEEGLVHNSYLYNSVTAGVWAGFAVVVWPLLLLGLLLFQERVKQKMINSFLSHNKEEKSE